MFKFRSAPSDVRTSTRIHQAAAALLLMLMTVSAIEAAPRKAMIAKERPVDVAVVGDSLANDLGQGLEALFRAKPKVRVIKQTHHATGLTRTDFFDWNAELRTFVSRTDADAIVVLIGGNDGQEIRIGSRRLDRFSQPWLEEYERRVTQFMRILQRERTKVYWVGLPVVRSDIMNDHFRTLNLLFSRQAKKHRITYVSTWKTFLDSAGDYTSFGPSVSGVKRQLRKDDGMHFTEDGKLRLAAHVAQAIGMR